MIEWKLHLSCSCDRVYEFLATAEGREAFWAESAAERNGRIEFVFPGGSTWTGRLLRAVPGRTYSVNYFGDSVVVFTLADDGLGGCDLTLTDTADDPETQAGWVSVLLTLKAAADFGVDLRNHDPARSWETRYADN